MTTAPIPKSDECPVVTVEEAGRWLGISRNSAYRAAAAGEIPVIRIGKRMVVPVAQLRRMLGLDAA